MGRCEAILAQVAALRQGVSAVAADLIAVHMERWIVDQVDADARREAIESLRDALSQMLKYT